MTKKLLNNIKYSLPFWLYYLIFRIKRSKFDLELQLTEHCNLNCIGCSHFSVLAPESYLDVEEYKKDFAKLGKVAKNYVKKIRLMGGEPLLHKDLNEIIKITRDNFPKTKIKIVTNGILLDKMNEDFWQTCKANNIIITISPYPINIKTEIIREMSQKFGIIVENLGFKDKVIFRKDVYDINGLQCIYHSFSKCTKRNCHNLYKGKFYRCPAPAYIHLINTTFNKNFEVLPADYLEISKIKSIKDIIKYRRKPISFCRYCNLNAQEEVPWGISKKESSEWGL